MRFFNLALEKLSEARNLQGREFIVGVSFFTDDKFQFFRTSEFNEVAEGDLGGETCKVSEPLNSC
jgi:hypothetical protein